MLVLNEDKLNYFISACVCKYLWASEVQSKKQLDNNYTHVLAILLP